MESRRGSCDDPDDLDKLTEIRDKLRNSIAEAQGRNAMLFDSGLVTGAVATVGMGVCSFIVVFRRTVGMHCVSKNSLVIQA